ncbi:MAG: NUDIX hydrolase [Anaerolineae bacterium]
MIKGQRRLRLRLKPWLLRVWRRLPGWLQGRIEWLLLPKWLVGAMAVVIDEQNRILLFQHTYRTDYAWGVPGGWLKGGENPVDAVEREIYEESGLRIKTLHPLVIGGDRDLRRIDLIFLCEHAGGAFQPSAEVSDAGFFTLDELPGRVEPFHVQVAAYALKVLAGEVYGQPPRAPTWVHE